MDKRQQHNELSQDEATLAVTMYEASLMANIIFVALNHMTLDEHSKRMARGCIIKLQKAALSISNRYLDSLR